MNVVRFFLVLAAVLLLARLVWRWLQPAPPPAGTVEKPTHALSRCSRCGTLVPQDLVLWHEEKPYCGPACRDGTAGRPG